MFRGVVTASFPRRTQHKLPFAFDEIITSHSANKAHLGQSALALSFWLFPMGRRACGVYPANKCFSLLFSQYRGIVRACAVRCGNHKCTARSQWRNRIRTQVCGREWACVLHKCDYSTCWRMSVFVCLYAVKYCSATTKAQPEHGRRRVRASTVPASH